MLTTNMTQLFEKLNDLKSVFKYGQKIIPIIQNLVDFMSETLPLLENINHSIADSTSKIPKAAHQISNVTHATELATTEILDLVDSISNEVGKIGNQVKYINERGKEILAKLSAVTQGNSEAQLLIDELENQMFSVVSNNINESITKINSDSYNITVSLQVQDITAQQLAAVNHLIESVQEKLNSLIAEISDAEIQEPNHGSMEIDAPSSMAFNPNARYVNNGESQKIADELIETGNTASQDEIDKLFS